MLADYVAEWSFERWESEKRSEERAVKVLEMDYQNMIERDGEEGIPRWRKEWQKRYDEAVEHLMVMSLACQKIHENDGCKIGSNIWNWGKLGTRTAQFKAEFLNEVNGYLRQAYSNLKTDL